MNKIEWFPGISQIKFGDWLPVGFWRLGVGSHRCVCYRSVSDFNLLWCVVDEWAGLAFVGSPAEISAYMVDHGHVLELL
jgi:hypothetical protein